MNGAATFPLGNEGRRACRTGLSRLLPRGPLRPQPPSVSQDGQAQSKLAVTTLASPWDVSLCLTGQPLLPSKSSLPALPFFHEVLQGCPHRGRRWPSPCSCLHPGSSHTWRLCSRAVPQGQRPALVERSLPACLSELSGQAPDAEVGVTEVRGQGVMDRSFPLGYRGSSAGGPSPTAPAGHLELCRARSRREEGAAGTARGHPGCPQN